MWAWYVRRECAIQAMLRVNPPPEPLCLPDLHSVHPSDGVFIMARPKAEPLCSTRRAPASGVRPYALETLLDGLDAMQAGDWRAPNVENLEKPSNLITQELRRRVLEDPTAPL